MPKNNNITSLQFNKPSLFEPTVIRGITNVQGDAVVLSKYNADEVSSTSLSSTSSFKYEPNLVGLKNTQQLNISWSQFENHTFFNSAQVKSNVAFQKIIDSFPFDGNRGEIDEFLDNLTGFERWVFEQCRRTALIFSFQEAMEKVLEERTLQLKILQVQHFQMHLQTHLEIPY